MQGVTQPLSSHWPSGVAGPTVDWTLRAQLNAAQHAELLSSAPRELHQRLWRAPIQSVASSKPCQVLHLTYTADTSPFS